MISFVSFSFMGLIVDLFGKSQMNKSLSTEEGGEMGRA
jgi:hypothetical protein